MKPLLLLSLLALTACSPKLAPTIVPAPSHDTCYIHDIQLDSVFVHESERTQHDTIYLTRVKERYRIQHDTIRVVHRDSIPYPVEVPIEVAKPIPKVYRYALWFVILFVLYWLVRLAIRLYLRR